MYLILVDGKHKYHSDDLTDVLDYLAETYGLMLTASTLCDTEFIVPNTREKSYTTVFVTDVPALFHWIPVRGGHYRLEHKHGMLYCYYRMQGGKQHFLRIHQGMELNVMDKPLQIRARVTMIEPSGWITFSGRFYITQVLKWNMPEWI